MGEVVCKAAVEPASSSTMTTRPIGAWLLAVLGLSGTVTVAPFEPAIGAALAAVGTDPTVPTYLDSELTIDVSQDSPVARRQDAAAAILWPMLSPGDEPRTQILVPPMKWSPQPDDARLILSTLANAVRSGLAVPRPLAAVITESAAASPETDPITPPSEDRGRFDDDVVATIAAQMQRLRGLDAAVLCGSALQVGAGRAASASASLVVACAHGTGPMECRCIGSCGHCISACASRSTAPLSISLPDLRSAATS